MKKLSNFSEEERKKVMEWWSNVELVGSKESKLVSSLLANNG